MRVAFAGTPEFARVALERLHAAGFAVPLVLTQPDRPAGRGLKLQAAPVKQFALDHGIAVAQPRSLRLDGQYPDDAAAARSAIEAARADVLVVAAYGLILPQWVLDALSAAGPPQGARVRSGDSAGASAPSVGAKGLGCLNIHASLLPRWRGAAPIQRAIEAGDAETGVTIMQMDAGLDTGAMLLAERIAIAADDNSARLHDKLAWLGGRLIVEALELAAGGGLRPTPQPAVGVSYAAKIDKAEARIDWRQRADAIERRLRAFDPAPGAQTTLDGEVLKVWRGQLIDARDARASVDAGARAAATDALPGTVLAADEHGVCVACGQGVLRLTQLQRAGGKRLGAHDFLRGFALSPGQRLGS